MQRINVLLLASMVCSCSASDDKGSASFVTWGEEYIEEGIPVSKTDQGQTVTVVEDGWAIKYEKFLVHLSAIKVGEKNGPLAFEQAGSVLVDHAKAGRKPLVTIPSLDAKAYNLVSYRIAPTTSNATVVGGASSSDLDVMVKGGYSVYVEAKATKGAVTKSFKWGFATATLFDQCKAASDGKEVDGIVVKPGVTESVELTIHGDHFFYDDLASGDAKLRFNAYASADADNDGAITLDELQAVELVKLTEGTYGTGSASNVKTLRAFVTELSRTIGHFRGEGECISTSIK